MAITKENLTATVTVETGDSAKNLDELANTLGLNTSVVTQFQKSIELLNETLNSKQIDQLTKAIENQNEILKNTDSLLVKYEENLNRSSDSTKQFQENTATLSKQVEDQNNLFLLAAAGISGLAIAGAHATGVFKTIGSSLNKADVNVANLYEGSVVLTALFGSLSLAISNSESEFLQFSSVILLVASAITGSFVLGVQVLLNIVSRIAYNVGTVLVDAMSAWEKQSAKAAEVTRQFIFTLKGFGDVFGTEVIGSLNQWQGVIDELVNNTTFSVQEVQKAVKLLVAEGKALGLSYKTNVDLLKRSADIAAQSGLSIEDVAIRIGQGLSGNSQSLIALGINISETALAHSKYVLASEKTVSQLTEQEKIQLRLNEVMAQTTPIIGAAEFQTNSIIGSQRQLQKAVDSLTMKLGEQSKAIIFYNRILTDFYTAFIKIPEPVIGIIGVFIDFGGVLLKVLGFIGTYLTIILSLATAHKIFNAVLVQSTAVQSAALLVVNALNTAFKFQTVTVVTATTVYATFAKVVGVVLSGAFATLIGLLKSLTVSIYSMTVAVLSNPLFYKAIAIAATIYYLIKALENVIESMGSLKDIFNISFSPIDSFISVLELLRSALISIGSVIEDVFTAALAGLVGTLLLVTSSFIRLYKLIKPPRETQELEVILQSLDTTLANVSARGTKSLTNLKNGVIGNSTAFAALSNDARKLSKSFDLAELSTKKLEKAAGELDKASIQLSITGDEADRLTITLRESQNLVRESAKEFIATEGTKKQILDQYLEGLKTQYKTEAQIAKLRSDSFAEIVRLNKSYTADQLRASGLVVEAIKLEFEERRKELNERIAILKKLGDIDANQRREIEKTQNAINRAEQAEIDNFRSKVKETALKRITDNLREEQNILKDINSKNSEINKKITIEGLTAREAIATHLQFELDLIDAQIEKASILYGSNNDIIKALELQKDLLNEQAQIEMDALLPRLPTDIIKKFWSEFRQEAKAQWTRISESFSDIDVPAISFEGMKDFGKQLFNAGEALGTSIAQGASAIFSYASIAIDVIKQAPEFLRSAFLELPYIILDSLAQIPAIIDEIIAKFPDIITKIADNIGPLLLQIAMKIDDLIIMILDQLPILIEKIAEALPEIIITLIKNIPRLIGAILNGIIKSVLGFIKGLGRGIMGLITGKGIRLDKIIDTKGMEDKIKKLSGETGRIFSVENLMEAAQDPVQRIYDIIEGAAKRAGDFLKQAWQWIMENIIQPIFDGLKAVWMFVYEKVILPIYNVVRNAWLWVFENVIKPIYDVLISAWRWAYDNIIKPTYDVIRNAWLWVYENVISPIVGIIQNAWQWVIDNVISPMLALGEKIASPLRDAFASAVRFFQQIGETFKTLFKLDFEGVKQAVSEAFQTAGEALRRVFAAVMNPIVDIFNGLIGALNGLKIPAIEWRISAGRLGSWSGKLTDDIDLLPGEIAKLPRFAQGGFVENLPSSISAFGSDTIPAMLTPGEFIMNRRAVENNGVNFLSALNRGQEVGGNTYNLDFQIKIEAKTNIDEGFIRGTLIPRMSEELRRASLDGKFIISSKGIR